jgi:hypothetical protein
MDDFYPIIRNVAILDIKYIHLCKILSQRTGSAKLHLWNSSNDAGARLRLILN